MYRSSSSLHCRPIEGKGRLLLRFAFVLSLTASSGACNQSSLDPSTRTVTQIPSSIPTYDRKPTLTPLPTSVDLVTTVRPDAIERCSSDYLGTLRSLGVDESSRLLINIGSDSRQRYQLVNPDMGQEALRIQNAEQFGRYNVVRISPDGQWYALKADGPGKTFNNLWIGSINGIHHQFVQEEFAYSHVFWVSKETIIVGNSEGGAADWPKLEGRFNPFTGHAEQLEPIYLQLGIFAFGPTGDQVVYVGSHPPEWRLHEFGTGIDVPILPWAKGHAIDIGDSVSWTEDGVSIALVSTEGLELSMNLVPDELKVAQVPRYQVQFENESKISGIVWWSSNNQRLGVIQTAPPPTEPPFARTFRILDTNAWVQYEYCLPPQLVPGVVHGSLDDRYLAWEGHLGEESGVLVLDIVTGKRVWLPNVVDLIGWATLIEP